MYLNYLECTIGENKQIFKSSKTFEFTNWIYCKELWFFFYEMKRKSGKINYYEINWKKCRLKTCLEKIKKKNSGWWKTI